MKLTHATLCLLLCLAAWACKPKRLIQQTTYTTDTIPTRFTPDPFSSLVDIETNLGILRIELFFETPTHRENFIKLAKENFYSNTLFHRVIKGFMAQAGDPNSRLARANSRLGNGGTGYELDHEINTHYYHLRGALAAARTSDEMNPEKKSSGCQFYIVDGRPTTDAILDQNERKYGIAYSAETRRLYKTLGGAPQLDMQYTVFGRVYDGLDILDKIVNKSTDNFDRPTEDVRILKVNIVKE